MSKQCLFGFNPPHLVDGLIPFFIYPAWSRRSFPDIDKETDTHGEKTVNRCYRNVVRSRVVRIPCPAEIRKVLLEIPFLEDLMRIGLEAMYQFRYSDRAPREFITRMRSVVDGVLDRLEREGLLIPVGHQWLYFPPNIWCPETDRYGPNRIYKYFLIFPLFSQHINGLVVPLKLRELAAAAGIAGAEFSPLVRVPVDESLQLKCENLADDWPILLPFIRQGIEKYDRDDWDSEYCFMEVRYFRENRGSYYPFPNCGACSSNLQLRYEVIPSPDFEIFERHGMGASDIYYSSGRYWFLCSERMCQVIREAGIDIPFEQVRDGDKIRF